MEPAGAVDGAVISRRNPWRGALLGAGLVVGAGLLVLFAPAPAHADDGDGLLGGVVSGVTGVVERVVDPVVEPLPSLRDVPIVGGIVGEVADSAPVETVTEPVSGIVDGLLRDTVASLPVVGDLLGDRPVGDILDPVAGTVDETLGDLVAGPEIGIPPVAPQPAAPTMQPDAAAAAVAASAIRSVILPVLARADHVGVIVAGAGNPPFGGFASVPGDSMPTSTVTASGPPGGLAAAVLGAGLLLILLMARVRPDLFRAPPTPTFDTDSSPD